MSIQLTLGLSAIHRTGIIHCDLKPHNVLIDLNHTIAEKYNCLKFIDFGLCERVIFHGKHVESMKDAGVKGTKSFMSRNAHKRESLSRRDDWESMCYLIYSMVAPLPWMNTKDEAEML